MNNSGGCLFAKADPFGLHVGLDTDPGATPGMGVTGVNKCGTSGRVTARGLMPSTDTATPVRPMSAPGQPPPPPIPPSGPNCDNSHPGTTIAASVAAACARYDFTIPHTAADIGPYVMGRQATANADGSPKLFCPAPQGGVMSVPAGTTKCPRPTPPPQDWVTPPGGITGAVSCGPGQQTTPEIRYVCQTGVDPGPAVNANPSDPGPNPTCTPPMAPRAQCFDLAHGKEHDAKGKVISSQ